MSWPLSQDYNEAIQDPRNSFADPELRQGEAAANALGIPMPRSGNFADVYEVRCPSGARWAVKCFTRRVEGLRERYYEISKYLRQAQLPFMVDFQYLDQGMRVRGQWYPVLKMQWVEGFVLNEFVRDNLDKKPILQALGQIWLRMARRLRAANLAHCDLQHGNVMLVPGSTVNSLAVKLIDYDGMCVPALAGKKSGEVGHPAYQHPERLRTGAYNQEVDRFSLLSIAAGLRCLTVGGRALWERYDNGDNLLFRQSDLQAPAESPLFKELLEIRDPLTQSLVKELYRACQGSLNSVPLVTDLVPEEKPPASKVTTAAGVAARSAAAGPDWDFDGGDPDASIVKKRRRARGVPLWVWGGCGGVAALALVGAALGVGLAFRNGATDNKDTPVAQDKPVSNIPNPRSNPPVKDGDPPVTNPNDPPPKPKVNRESPRRIFQLSPAGDMLAISDEGNTTWRLVEPGTKRMIREFRGHTGAVVAIVFSPDGKRALTAGEENRVRLWDVQTGQTITSARTLGDQVVSIALAADGKHVASANGGKNVNVMDFETKKGVSYGHLNEVFCVAYSPDGRYLICGFHKSDKFTGAVIQRWTLKPGGAVPFYKGISTPVGCLAVSGDGQYIASGHNGTKNEVALWELESGKLLWRVPMLGGSIHHIVFSPDSRFLLMEASNRYHVWRVGPKPETVMGGADVNQERVSATFTTDSRTVTFAYRKDDFSFAQSVPLPARFVGNPPDPTPRPIVAWDPPTNPDGDCKFAESDGKLTITLPGGKVHDLAAESGRMNAPRLLRDVEGDFTVQVHVAGDFSDKGTEAAGLLLMVDDKTYVRVERGRLGETPSFLWELRQDGKKMPASSITAPLSGAEGYVRLERRGGKLFGSYSMEGEKWSEPKLFELQLPAKVKIGVAAISVFTTFAPTFDQFQFKQGQGAMVRLDKWLTRGSVVVKPPPKPPVRRSPRLAVPDPGAVGAAARDIRARHKDEYKGDRNKLQQALWNETNGAGNDPPRLLALFREIRNINLESNLGSSLFAAQQISQRFDVNPLEVKYEVFEMASRGTSKSITGQQFVEAALPVLDEALGEGEFDLTGRLAKLLRAVAKKTPEEATRQLAERRAGGAEKIKQQHDKIAADEKVLASNANDAKANLAVGKFHAVDNGDWEEALSFLARGGDAALKALAEKELASSDEPAARADLGDAWRAQAAKTTGALSRACLRRAYECYQEAAAGLPRGAKLTAAKSQLAQLSKSVAELRLPWHNLGVYDHRITADLAAGFLHVPSGQRLFTRQCYRGPIDITFTVRCSQRNNLTLGAGEGGQLFFSSFNGDDRLQVSRPDAVAPGLPGSSAGGYSVAVRPDEWTAIRWRITSSGMKVWLKGKVIVEDSRPLELSEKRPVSFHGNGAALDVKSVMVNRARDK